MNENKKLSDKTRTTENNDPLNVVTFKDTSWLDHSANIMGGSERSVRVESDRPINPGVVWFNDRVRGYKSGIVIWCQQVYGRYRAVMQLIPLTRDEERIVQERAVQANSHRPYRSLENIIASITGSVRIRNES